MQENRVMVVSYVAGYSFNVWFSFGIDLRTGD